MRLIDADALCRSVDRYKDSYPSANAIISVVAGAPTVEAEPVRHANTIYMPNSKGYPSCSYCHEEMPFFLNFCPCCGARMDVTDTDDGKGGTNNG